jgi:hypothetical protein
VGKDKGIKPFSRATDEKSQSPNFVKNSGAVKYLWKTYVIFVLLITGIDLQTLARNLIYGN